jgi:bacterioferritin
MLCSEGFCVLHVITIQEQIMEKQPTQHLKKKKIGEAIQETITEGPITKQCPADPFTIVRSLHRVRATEISSHLQYKQHAYMEVSLVSPGLKSEFEAYALKKLEHADTLAHRIQQLGGAPVFDLQELAGKAVFIGARPERGTTLVEMMGEDLMLEHRQVEAYSALIQEIGDKDLVTRQLLLDILQTTERHAGELADYLKRSSETLGVSRTDSSGRDENQLKAYDNEVTTW